MDSHYNLSKKFYKGLRIAYTRYRKQMVSKLLYASCLNGNYDEHINSG
jgi:hypothetical protein